MGEAGPDNLEAKVQGLRVLVVEDEFLMARLLEDVLNAYGCEVVGPVPRLDRAMDAARTETLDGAVLDINLAGEVVFPVAEELLSRDIPFIFATGYSTASLPPRFHETPRLQKPFPMTGLIELMAEVFR